MGRHTKARKPYAEGDDEPIAGEGHNIIASEELEKSVLERYGHIQNEIKKLRNDAKDILQEGKDSGVLKSSVRNAYKELSMSEDARQAQKEVDNYTRRLVALGGDMPLFHVSAIGRGE